MKKHFANIFKLLVSLGIGVVLVYWFISQMSDSDKQQVVSDIQRANYLWVIAAPLIGFLSNYFRTQRWRLLLRPLGYNPRFWNTFFSVMMMYFLNLFFPRLGEVSRCGALARYEKVPLDKAIGTMVIERVLDVICIALIALILLVVEHDKFIELYDVIVANSKTTFADIIAKNEISPTLKYSVFTVVGLGIAGFIVYRIRKTGFMSLFNTIREKVTGLLQGVLAVKDLDQPILFLFHTAMIWICYVTMAYVNFFIFPETSHLPLVAAGVCLFFSGVAFSLTPGGLGLYPIFMKIILGLYGVVGSAAISSGLVSWTAQTISVLAAGVISMILLAILNREPALEG
jgi:uncharacterized protein (TIRG00374 family)